MTRNMSKRDLCRIMLTRGWRLARTTRDGHEIWHGPDGQINKLRRGHRNQEAPVAMVRAVLGRSEEQ